MTSSYIPHRTSPPDSFENRTSVLCLTCIMFYVISCHTINISKFELVWVCIKQWVSSFNLHVHERRVWKGLVNFTLVRFAKLRSINPWWRHQMETFSALLAICAGNSPVPGEFPAQRPVTRSFDVFFDLCLNKWLSKQSWGWWFETLSCPLWRHCNALWPGDPMTSLKWVTTGSGITWSRECVN